MAIYNAIDRLIAGLGFDGLKKDALLQFFKMPFLYPTAQMEGVFIWALGFLESVALNYKYNIVLESISEIDLDLFLVFLIVQL